MVQKKPPVIGNVGCQTHIYVCGECLWLDGMVPGATVEVQVGGVLRGSGRADYDATNLTVKLFDQPAGPWNSGGAFIEPTVIQGRVYVGSDRLLTVLGL